MNNLLVLLFAVLECRAWDLHTFISTIDQLVRLSTRPKPWLVELSASTSVDDSLAIIRKAMQDSGVMLPDDVGDLLAGLVLLCFDKGELSSEDANRILVDIVDAYGTSCVDAEMAARIDLKDSTYTGFRRVAAESLKYLSGYQLSVADRRLIEN